MDEDDCLVNIVEEEDNGIEVQPLVATQRQYNHSNERMGKLMISPKNLMNTLN